MKVGERIRDLRVQQGLKGVQLAARSGLNQSYLSKLERGKAGYTEDGLKKIAAALGIRLSTIFGGSNVEMAALPSGRRIPILNYIQAGKLAVITDTLPSDEVTGYVFVDEGGEGEDLFALIVRGDSMEPGFSEGDVVIIKRSPNAQPGDFVVGIDSAGEATFKKLKVLSDDKAGRRVFALVPLNDSYPTLRSDELQLTVSGYMVEHRKYRRKPAQR